MESESETQESMESESEAQESMESESEAQEASPNPHSQKKRNHPRRAVAHSPRARQTEQCSHGLGHTAAAPLLHRIRGRGAYWATPRPTNLISSVGRCARRRYSAKMTRMQETGQPGVGPFGVWGDVLRGGPLPAVSSHLDMAPRTVQGVSIIALAPT